MEKLKIKEINQVNYVSVIDGIKFKTPESFEEYLLVGLYTFLLLIAFPFWIIPYLVGRIIRTIAPTKKIKTQRIKFECPACHSPMMEGDYRQIKCNACGYYQYSI